MVKTKGSFFSTSASGSLGKVLTSSNWKGREYLKKHSLPKNPNSDVQVSIRAMMRYLSQRWTDISASDKNTWTALAARENTTLISAFIGEGMQRWTTGRPPAELYPAPEDGIAGGLNFPPPTLQGRGPIITAVIPPGTDIVAVLFYRDLPNGFIPAFENFKFAKPGVPLTGVTWHDFPLAPGTYRYKTLGLTREGDFGPATGQRTFVMP